MIFTAGGACSTRRTIGGDRISSVASTGRKPALELEQICFQRREGKLVADAARDGKLRERLRLLETTLHNANDPRRIERIDQPAVCPIANDGAAKTRGQQRQPRRLRFEQRKREAIVKRRQQKHVGLL